MARGPTFSTKPVPGVWAPALHSVPSSLRFAAAICTSPTWPGCDQGSCRLCPLLALPKPMGSPAWKDWGFCASLEVTLHAPGTTDPCPTWESCRESPQRPLSTVSSADIGPCAPTRGHYLATRERPPDRLLYSEPPAQYPGPTTC